MPIWEIPFPALTLCNMNKVTYTAQVPNQNRLLIFSGSEIQSERDRGCLEEGPNQPLPPSGGVLHRRGR